MTDQTGAGPVIAVLQQIVQVYNERIDEAETDASLRIELR
jgi:hypothetical protein